jgi:hypothetical protein
MLRTIVAGALIIAMTSCTSWTPISIAPASYIRMHDPEAVWVQLQDGSTLVLARPRVMGDTLRGITAGAYRNVPLSQVARLRAQEPARKKTAVVVGVSVVLAAGLIYMLAHSDRITQP